MKKEYLSEIANVTVVFLVNEPLGGSEAGFDKPHGFSYVNTN